MKVKHITIMGVGLIGGSFGLALKAALGSRIQIAAMDKDGEAARTAVEQGAADEIFWEMKDLGKTDIVIMCTPVLQMLPLMEEMIPFLKAGTIITDVGSTKGFIAEKVKGILPETVEYVAGHPMAGREQSGILAANKDLFRDKWYILIPEASTSQPALEEIASLVEQIGARITTLDIGTHDACAAVISHVPHVTAAALVNLLEMHDDPEASLKLAGGGFRDTTRIASSNADMWSDICMTNGEEITKSLLQLQTIIGKVVAAIEQKDRQQLHDFFSKAKARRDCLMNQSGTSF